MENKVKIEDLAGVGPSTASKLNEAGYHNVQSLAAAPITELVNKAGLTQAAAFKIVEEARRHTSVDLITAKELMEKRKKMNKISLGSDSFNRLLGGGLETQAITEFWGEYASGKSQLCMYLAAMVQHPIEKGGLDAKALFIDTEGTFHPQRLYQIAELNGLDPEKALENIVYARCYNSDHQQLIVDHAFKICQEENIKLVVVDSVITHWRSEYIGRENLSERQQKLNNHVHKLLRLAEVFNLAVVVTNQVQANPQAFFGNPNRPAGGNVLAHGTTHRIYLKKSSKNLRVASITDSPSLPPDEQAFFAITGKGIEEAQPKT